jgi:drug/metabolite transporter (DMT)-like permease
MNKKMMSYIAVILAMTCWSLTFVWYKDALVNFMPISLVVSRLVLATLIMFPIMLLTKTFQKPTKKQVPYFFLLALFEPFLYFLGESNGMQYVSATTGAVVIAIIPLFAPFTDRIFFKKTISAANIIGILVSIIGVFIVVSQSDGGLNASMKGIMWLLLAVFGAVFYSVVVYKLSQQYNALTIIGTQNAIGFFYFLPIFFINEFAHFKQISWSFEVLLPVIELSIFGSVLAFIGFTYAIKHLGISRSNVFTNLIPVLTAIFAYFIKGDPISVMKAVGIGVVISGLLLSQMGKKKIN